MPNDNFDQSKSAKDSEKLISVKNAGLVMLPWMILQQDMLKQAKLVAKNQDHPVRNLLSQFVKTAYCSQLGLQIALKDRPLGKLLAEVSEPLGKTQTRLADAIEDGSKKFAETAKDLIETYEAILDVTVEEVRKKTDKQAGTAPAKPAARAAASKKKTASNKTASMKAKSKGKKKTAS